MILFVAPLPPPVHGFSVINAAMLSRFKAAAVVTVFDRAPAAGVGAWRRLAAAAGLWLRYLGRLLGHHRAAGLYIGLSGGLGQLVDLPYLLAARLLRRPVLVHHHSFAYLRRRPWHARLVLRAARQARHIVLCDTMARALTACYGVPADRVDVVSNAAFLEPVAMPLAPPRPGHPLRLGFLSNITADKGIWTFLALGDLLAARGLGLQARVAGPVANEIAQRFAREIDGRPWCRHLGAVYGAQKEAFFADIDVLVFPTVYANEAEPVTLLEALRLGVPVVANARGCIVDMLPAGAGLVCHDDARFVTLAAQRLADWAREGATAWQARRQAAHDGFGVLQALHAQRLGALVSAWSASGSARGGEPEPGGRP